MRVTPDQIATIIQTTRSIAGADANVWLYGSRLDDSRRGGDLDLLIESVPVAGFLQRAQIKNRLEQILQLPVDLLATSLGVQDSPFVSIARANAVNLTKLQHTPS
jgi:predicted nucleotidyltransferase